MPQYDTRCTVRLDPQSSDQRIDHVSQGLSDKSRLPLVIIALQQALRDLLRYRRRACHQTGEKPPRSRTHLCCFTGELYCFTGAAPHSGASCEMSQSVAQISDQVRCHVAQGLSKKPPWLIIALQLLLRMEYCKLKSDKVMLLHLGCCGSDHVGQLDHEAGLSLSERIPQNRQENCRAVSWALRHLKVPRRIATVVPQSSDV